MHYLISNLFAKFEPFVLLRRFQSHDTLQRGFFFKDSLVETKQRADPGLHHRPLIDMQVDV